MYRATIAEPGTYLVAMGWQVIQSYIQLTKPRIIVLLLVTTIAGMAMAANGHIDPLLLLITLVGGACAAGAANTMNCLYDRDLLLRWSELVIVRCRRAVYSRTMPCYLRSR